MAISGSGTSTDPYIVSTWEDLLTVNDSSYYVKFANPHEEGEMFVLSGSGTSMNPYIVSTYEEMLFATGATYIWEVKLIDREQKIYRYEDIYCQYDDSLTTIDFNDIQPNGYSSTFVLNPKMNFNGWTLKNAVFHDYGYFRRDMIVDPTAETPTFNDTAVLPLMTLYDDVFEFEVSTPDQSSEVNFDLVFREGRL